MTLALDYKGPRHGLPNFSTEFSEYLSHNIGAVHRLGATSVREEAIG